MFFPGPFIYYPINPMIFFNSPLKYSCGEFKEVAGHGCHSRCSDTAHAHWKLNINITQTGQGVWVLHWERELLYGRKIFDLTEPLTLFATPTLLYTRKWPRSPRKPLKYPPVSSCVATSTNLKIFIAIISTVLLVIIDK